VYGMTDLDDVLAYQEQAVGRKVKENCDNGASGKKFGSGDFFFANLEWEVLEDLGFVFGFTVYLVAYLLFYFFLCFS
jgi:hypothetical protein